MSPSGPAALTTVLHRLRAAGLELETTRPPSTADMPERMSSVDAMATDTVGTHTVDQMASQPARRVASRSR